MDEKSCGKHDPGWNDPPLFSFDTATAIQASASKKGVTLNKRVAYPVSSKAVNASQTTAPTPLVLPPVNEPPPVSLDKPTQVPQEKCASNIDVNEFESLSKSERLNKVLKNLESLLPGDDGGGEISKRIKIMEKMWVEDKLDAQVQLRVIGLTEALCKGDTELADRLQMGLMVDYVSQCSSWMSGIRQLINLKRNAK